MKLSQLFIIGAIAVSGTAAVADPLVDAKGEARFAYSPNTPPQFTIRGDAAKEMFNYLRSEVFDDDYSIPKGSVKEKNGRGVTCRHNLALKTFECDLIFDSGGLYVSQEAL